MPGRTRLDDARLAEALASLLWQRDRETLIRTVRRRDFRDAIAFVGIVADIAEAMDHHPDIDIRWRDVTLRVTTHSAGGLTEMDLEFARRVDAAAGDEASAGTA